MTTDLEKVKATASDLISQGKMEDAKERLSNGLVEYPNSAQLHFLQAAVYAQLESYDDAISHYQKSLHLEPQLFIARFQLGLLLATLGENEKCIDVLDGLVSLDEHYLSLFAKGIINTLTNQLDSAIDSIRQGLKANNENPSLNKDMKAMLARIESEQNTNDKDSVETNEKPAVLVSEEADQSHLLDIYQTKH